MAFVGTQRPGDRSPAFNTENQSTVITTGKAVVETTAFHLLQNVLESKNSSIKWCLCWNNYK